MAAKINRTVLINGKRRNIRAQTEQEYADRLAVLMGVTKSGEKHNFRAYSEEWFETFSKPNISTVTAETYYRQLTLYLWPAFGDKNLEDITVAQVQKLFNDMHCAKSTKEKAKTVLNMIFEAAIDDEYLGRNPLRSKKFRLTGGESHVTEEYSVEQMRYLIAHLDDILRDDDRAYLALQALHPLRLEEVLGLKWEDVDVRALTLTVRRAATHPTRNQAEVKVPKTEASQRTLGLSELAVKYLHPGEPNSFIFGGAHPYSYTQVRNMCQRIQRDTGFAERIVPIRFRTTVLTDIYGETKDIKAAQSAAGHTTSAMTLKHYVKGRTEIRQTADAIDRLYGG